MQTVHAKRFISCPHDLTRHCNSSLLVCGTRYKAESTRNWSTLRNKKSHKRRYSKLQILKMNSCPGGRSYFHCTWSVLFSAPQLEDSQLLFHKELQRFLKLHLPLCFSVSSPETFITGTGNHISNTSSIAIGEGWAVTTSEKVFLPESQVAKG